MNDIIKAKLKTLPTSSGVYLMMDIEGRIIYIGKAKVLSNRVRQYFMDTDRHHPKVAAMVEHIADLSYIITESELDALSLEATLIRKHKPHYNILLKDDKQHPYIRINVKVTYPSLEIVRRVKADGAKYFGPFFGGVRVKEIVEILKCAYKLRTCNNSSWPSSHRHCLNYHIEQCSGPCLKSISPEDYRTLLNKAIAFLNGDTEEVREILTNRIENCKRELLYELAIQYRDRLFMLDRLNEKVLVNIPRYANFDCFGYATNNLHSAIAVSVIRAGKTIAVEHYPIIEPSIQSEAVAKFVIQYYDGSRLLPEELVIEEAPEDIEAVRELLRTRYSHKPTVTVPKQGDKYKLLSNAVTNARDYCEKCIDILRRKENMTHGAVLQLKQMLGLNSTPYRVECYDISNISGTDKVASMVVFIDGSPSKSDYRRFKVKTVEGSDDFASMKEVLDRRFAHLKGDDAERFGARPDLIVVDGGKGQLSSAVEAMRQSGCNVEMIGLAKREEEVFRIGESLPIILPRSSLALRMLQRIRDEAHRFAITYHRALRSNRYVSQLEDIHGIGKERRVSLLTHFKSIDAIKAATIEELLEAPKMTRPSAEKVCNFFRQPQDAALTQSSADQDIANTELNN